MANRVTEPDDPRASRLLTGSVRKALFLLALPVLAEQTILSLVGFCDTFLSGRISENATAAIGVAAYTGWLASLTFGLVATGTTALVARSYGEGDYSTANRIANRSMAMAVFLGFLFYIFLFFAAPLLARELSMTGETYDIVVRYLRLDGLGHIFTSLSIVGAAALRGAGNMRTPMLIFGLVGVLNAIVSTAFVYGIGPFPNLGVDGIVTGTVIARVIGALVMLAVLGKGVGELKLVWQNWFAGGEDDIRRILRIGAPAIVDGGIMWAGHFAYLMIIRKLGDAAFAAHVIGIQVEAITYLPAVAWGYASATLIGQSLGARDLERAKRVGHEAVFQCSLLAACTGLAFYLAAEPIYHVMHINPEVREIGVKAFRLLAFFQIPLVLSIVYVHSFRGAGDTRTPLVLTLIGMALIRLPLGYLFGIALHGGLRGAWIGMCADVLFRGCTAMWLYSSGRWLSTRV